VNGTLQKILFTFIGVCITLLCSAGGIILKMYSDRISEIEHTLSRRGDSVVSLEARMEVFEQELARANRKIDLLLTREAARRDGTRAPDGFEGLDFQGGQ